MRFHDREARLRTSQPFEPTLFDRQNNFKRGESFHDEGDVFVASMVAAAGTGKVIDRYGFVVGLDPAMALRPETEITAAKRENERSLKWQSMIASWQTFAHGEGRPTLKRRVRKGIPDGVRGHIWSQAWKVGAAASSSPEDAQRRYLALQGRPSEMDEQIRKDLHRTMPGHAQFVRGASGQEQLFRVCHALAVFRPDVGYNQAEAYVAAALLTYMAGRARWAARWRVFCGGPRPARTRAVDWHAASRLAVTRPDCLACLLSAPPIKCALTSRVRAAAAPCPRAPRRGRGVLDAAVRVLDLRARCDVGARHGGLGELRRHPRRAREDAAAAAAPAHGGGWPHS
jgi:hypothetical protein